MHDEVNNMAFLQQKGSVVFYVATVYIYVYPVIGASNYHLDSVRDSTTTNNSGKRLSFESLLNP